MAAMDEDANKLVLGDSYDANASGMNIENNHQEGLSDHTESIQNSSDVLETTVQNSCYKLDNLMSEVDDKRLDLAFTRRECPRRVVDLLIREHLATMPRMPRSIDTSINADGINILSPEKLKECKSCKSSLKRTMKTACNLGKEFTSLTEKLNRLHQTVLLNKQMSKNETDAILFSAKRRRITSTPIATMTPTRLGGDTSTPTTAVTLPGGDTSTPRAATATRPTENGSSLTATTTTPDGDLSFEMTPVTPMTKYRKTRSSMAHSELPHREPKTTLNLENTPVTRSTRKSSRLTSDL